MPPRKRPSQATLSGGARKAARVSVASTPSSSSSASRLPASQIQSQARPVATAAAARQRQEEEQQRLQYQQQQYPTYEEDEHEVIDLTQAVERDEREFYGTLGRSFCLLLFLAVGEWSGVVLI